MFISLSFKYDRYGVKVLFYILSIMFLGANVGFILNLPYAWISLIISTVLFILFTFLAILLTVRSRKLKRVMKKGKPGFIGEIIPCDKNDEIRFYYQLDDGRIGLTKQCINKKVLQKIKNNNCQIVPTILYQNKAVVDSNFIKKSEDLQDFQQNNIHIGEKINKIEDTFYYGNLFHGLVLFFLGILSATVVYILFFGNIQNYFSYSTPFLPMYIFFFLMNPLPVIFISIGGSIMKNYYFLPKIREEDRLAKKNYPKGLEKEGILLPLKNTLYKNESFSAHSKVAFVYQDDEGKWHKITQRVSAAMRDEIDSKQTDKIQILVWKKENDDGSFKEHAVIDQWDDDTKFRKFLGKIKDWKLAFYFSVALNTFFFARELVDVIQSKFTSSLSIFNAIIYLMGIIYMVGMFLIEQLVKDKKKGKFIAYSITMLFLALNLVILPGVYIASSATEDMSFVVMAQSIFNTAFMNSIIVFFYMFYLSIKFIYAIMKSNQAKKLGEDYDRCTTFGDIMSSFYTLLVFVFHLITIMIMSRLESVTEGAISFQESKFLQGFFLVLLAGLSIADIILFIKCAIKMRATFKKDKKKNKPISNQ